MHTLLSPFAARCAMCEARPVSVVIGVTASLSLLLACGPPDGPGPVEPDPTASHAPGHQQVQGDPARGDLVFFEETFGGNGRTCGTCHPRPNLVLTPEDIAALPRNDLVFVGKLDVNRKFIGRALFQYPLGGTSMLKPDIQVQRAVLGIFNLPRTDPFLTDGRADDLREQIPEAVLLHFHDGVLNRGKRMPTRQEIEDLVAFMESVQSPSDPGGPGPLAAQGQGLFFGSAGCGICHFGPVFTDNDFHNTGVVDDADPDFRVDDIPFDPGRCRLDPAANDCATSGASFNTPQLGGGRLTAPFFHNNSRATLRRVVEFYNSDSFTDSPANIRLGIGALNLTEEEIDAIAAFLESL